MPYVAPTPATFKARYPEFAAVSDALVQLVLNDAIDQVGDTWLERDRARAQMLLAAHILTMEGEPGRTATGNGTSGVGMVKRRKVGDVETEFAGTGSAAGGSGSMAWYALSGYGQQYLLLLRQNFPPIAAV
ncbi:DUF4054 domain-containing protein [Rhizobium sp. MHM7A]|uniref:DUF4054 domain-containing protein n=1 Tax=Rhizobium sp. MHM7A TaxID=2583233 RepID=UPI00110648DE|nr:DUF4054 domain-containing protein [Rhizobium sp. MHM7A]TLX12143.1 DUF4054 domain-containing protein [Rhizobium sp. MHM7A]